MTLSLIVSTGIYYFVTRNYGEVVTRFEKAEYLVDRIRASGLKTPTCVFDMRFFKCLAYKELNEVQKCV